MRSLGALALLLLAVGLLGVVVRSGPHSGAWQDPQPKALGQFAAHCTAAATPEPECVAEGAMEVADGGFVPFNDVLFTVGSAVAFSCDFTGTGLCTVEEDLLFHGAAYIAAVAGASCSGAQWLYDENGASPPAARVIGTPAAIGSTRQGSTTYTVTQPVAEAWLLMFEGDTFGLRADDCNDGVDDVSLVVGAAPATGNSSDSPTFGTFEVYQ